MDNNKKLNNLHDILADIVIYNNPKSLKKEIAIKVDLSKVDTKAVNKYYLLIVAIDQAFRRVQKYPIFFEEFYPNSKNISEIEALKHHVHAYLQDMTAFKNKVTVFLGTLKNDLKRDAENKEEIEKALRWLAGQVANVFAQVSEHRDPHHHNGLEFSDPDIMNATTATSLLALNKSQNLFNSDFISQLEEQQIQSFQKAKEKWFKIASDNAKEVEGFIDDIMGRNKDFLYKLLNIQSLREIISQ